MSYSKSGNSAPSFIKSDEAFLVSTEDAQKEENRLLGIKTPGWIRMKKYEGADSTRVVVETMVAFSGKGTKGVTGTLPADPDPQPE